MSETEPNDVLAHRVSKIEFAETYVKTYRTAYDRLEDPRVQSALRALPDADRAAWGQAVGSAFKVQGPKDWGPVPHAAGEYAMLCLALQYPGRLPPEGQKILDTFLCETMMLLLPCTHCMRHYAGHLRRKHEQQKWPMTAIEGLRFLVDVHNFTNKFYNRKNEKEGRTFVRKPEDYSVSDALRRMHVPTLADAIRSAKVALAKQPDPDDLPRQYSRDALQPSTRGPERSAAAGARVADGGDAPELASGDAGWGQAEGAAAAGRFVLIIIAVVLVATAATVATAAVRRAQAGRGATFGWRSASGCRGVRNLRTQRMLVHGKTPALCGLAGMEFEQTEVLVVPAWAYVLMFVLIVAVVAYIVVLQSRPDLILGSSGGDIHGPPPTPRVRDGGPAKVPEQMNTAVFTRYAENGIVRESYHQGGDHHVKVTGCDPRFNAAKEFATKHDIKLDFNAIEDGENGVLVRSSNLRSVAEQAAKKQEMDVAQSTRSLLMDAHQSELTERLKNFTGVLLLAEHWCPYCRKQLADWVRLEEAPIPLTVLVIADEARHVQVLRDIMYPALSPEQKSAVDAESTPDGKARVWQSQIVRGVPMNVFVKDGKGVRLQPGYKNTEGMMALLDDVFGGQENHGT